MRREEIFIPWRGPTLNEIYSGMDWRKRKRIADAGHLACIVARKIPEFTAPVSLTFVPIIKKGERSLDCSNYAFSAKVIEDGLVKYNVLGGDSNKHVQGFTILPPIRTGEFGMRVIIEEIQGEQSAKCDHRKAEAYYSPSQWRCRCGEVVQSKRISEVSD